MAHLWARWLRDTRRLGDPHYFRAGGKIRSGPLVGKVAMSPLPSRGSPLLQNGGGNQKWPTCGQSGYVTPAVSGIPTAADRGGILEVAHLWARWLRDPRRLGDPHYFRAGEKSELAHLWAKWLRHPCRLGDPHRFRAGGKKRSGPLVGKVATSPLPSRGSPPLQSGGGNQKWPTCGQSGYVTPAVSGSPPLQSGGQNQKWPTCGQGGYVTPTVSGIRTASERGAKKEVAHLWAKWLHHPCRLGYPHRCRAGGKIRSGPLVGKVATSPLPSRGSPPLQSGGQKKKWPTCGQSGYVTPAVSGIPTAAERGRKSEVAHLWAKWLRHPCRLRDPHRFTAGGKIRSGPLVGKVATSPLPSRGSPPLQSGGQNRAKWLRNPCRLADPHRFRAGGEIRSGPLVGKVATQPLPSRGSPPLQSRGAKSEVAHLWARWLRHPCYFGDPHRFRAGRGNQKWPTCGQSGYVTPAVSGIPSAVERVAKKEVAHLWARWLRHPYRLGDPHRFRAGGEIRSGPLVGNVATSPLPSRGSPLLQNGGQNQRWPTCGQGGYVTPAVSGIPTAAERGGKSEVAHLWATQGTPLRALCIARHVRCRVLSIVLPAPSFGSP